MKKKTLIVLLGVIMHAVTFAQQKDFEGRITYKIDVKSKVEGVADRIWRNTLALGDSFVAYISKGNYRQITGKRDTYFINKDQKIYYRFKGIDTLFSYDYTDDSSIVSDISKQDEKRNIAGFECKSITIKTSSFTRKYYYSPTLYMNPEYDKNNKVGRYDVFARETSSLYLAVQEENDSYSYIQTCTSVNAEPVDQTVFELPKLPVKIFSVESVVTPPRLAGNSNRWINYLQSNLNAELGAKYVKIAKGEQIGVVTIIVAFLINENGKVITARVVNKDVHPKLAEEAVRVILGSPIWIPATVYGEKSIYWYKQPVVFQTSRK